MDENSKKIKEELKKNEAFKCFVEKYCKKHEISVEEALEHELVKSVGEYYRDIRINVTKDKK